jgi:hypothetical protein
MDNNFDLIHCDLWTSSIVSISSYKYYLVILNDRFCQRSVVRYLEYEWRECKLTRSILGEHKARDLDWFEPSGE